VGAALLVAAVALQLADLEPRYRGLRGYFHDRFVVKALERPQELRDPFWAKAADHYHHLAMVPVVHIPPGYEKFATLAALHHMTFNTGYFSRVDAAAYGAANARAVAQLTSGTLDPGTLYVLWDKAAEIPVHRDPRVMDTVIEGVRVIAPGWSPHTPADRTAPSAPR
jgi:hypothetical protein